MERQFGLPVAFAAAAHAALLFAFSKEPASAPLKLIPDFIAYDLGVPPPEPEPVRVDDESAERGPKEEIAVPVPTTAEPIALAVSTDRLVMPIPPIRPVYEGDATNIVPATFVNRPGGGDGPGGNIIPREFLDNNPRTRFQPAPIYPHEGKMQGMRGEVVVEFRVDEQGRVHDPRVLSSSNRIFEEPTLRAVAKWLFEPGKRDGRAVPFKMAIPVVFSLND